MIETGKQPFPPEETLEMIKALVMGETARQSEWYCRGEIGDWK
jgi:hypothetical protein